MHGPSGWGSRNRKLSFWFTGSEPSPALTGAGRRLKVRFQWSSPGLRQRLAQHNLLPDPMNRCIDDALVETVADVFEGLVAWRDRAPKSSLGSNAPVVIVMSPLV